MQLNNFTLFVFFQLFNWVYLRFAWPEGMRSVMSNTWPASCLQAV